jgi:hypothetical protein
VQSASDIHSSSSLGSSARALLLSPGSHLAVVGYRLRAVECCIDTAVHTSLGLDADVWSVAVPLREAMEQRPPGCGRCLLRPARSRLESSRRPRWRLIDAMVGGRRPVLLLPPKSARADPCRRPQDCGGDAGRWLLLSTRSGQPARLCKRVEGAAPDRAPALDSALVLSPTTATTECAGETLGLSGEHTPGVSARHFCFPSRPDACLQRVAEVRPVTEANAERRGGGPDGPRSKTSRA